MTTASSSQVPHQATKKYQYRPIESPDRFRILKLLPGRGDEPIRIKLYHRHLSFLPRCEALSYEWGSPSRDHEIYCNGKVLKVTANLLAALKRLRYTKSISRALKELRAPWKSRLLWVDALCINQEDIIERSEQVKLMANIYRNTARTLVWIGEEPPLAKEAFALVAQLAKIIEPLDRQIHSKPSLEFLHENYEISPGYNVERLKGEPVWSSLLDIVASRTYFSRLWTVQEVALSDEIKICCGSHSMSWSQYRDAAMLFQYWDLLVKELTGSQLDLVMNIQLQGDLRQSLEAGDASLDACIHITRYRMVTDRRDRIFGLLGMVDSTTRSRLQEVDYASSLGTIFQAATECLIKGGANLGYLSYIQTSLVDRIKEPDIPSWVLWLNNSTLRSVELPFVTGSGYKVPARIPINLRDSVIEAFGFVFDTVVYASDNLSEENFNNQVLKTHDELTKPSETSKDPDSAIQVLWYALISWSETPKSKDHLDLVAWIAQMKLGRMGFTEGILAQNPKLSILAKDSPAITSRFATALEADLDVETLLFEDEELKKWTKQALEGDGVSMENHLTRRCKGRLFDPTAPHGRNIFISARGYCGVGPLGDNSPGENSPAVQVGDVIAILSTANAPVILRRIDDEYFSLLGICYVSYLTDDPQFEKGLTEEFKKFRIR